MLNILYNFRQKYEDILDSMYVDHETFLQKSGKKIDQLVKRQNTKLN